MAELELNGLETDADILVHGIRKLGDTLADLQKLDIESSDPNKDLAIKMAKAEMLLRVMKEDLKYVQNRREAVSHQVAVELMAPTVQVKFEVQEGQQ